MALPILYHSDLSPCAFKVRLLLEDRSIAWESRIVNLMKKENLAPEYLKINSKGLVPVLVTEDGTVTESTIILEYLEDKYSENGRRPDDPLLRAQMRLLMRIVDEKLHPLTAPIVFGGLVRFMWMEKTEEEREHLLSQVPDPARQARQRRLIADGLEAEEVMPAIDAWVDIMTMLDGRLAQNTWLIGEDICLADFCYAPYVFILEYLKVHTVFERLPNLEKWFAAIKSRPSFSKSLDPFVSEDRFAIIGAITDKSGSALEQKFNAAFDV